MSKILLKEKTKNYEKIEQAINFLDDNFKNNPSISSVAEHLEMSVPHFTRVFKEYVGVTPKQFLHSITLNYAKEHLLDSKSILDSSLEIGLSSTSRMHELFVNMIGVTPGEWKKLGEDVTITYAFGFTPFGKALIATTQKGICFLEFIDNNEEEILQRLTNMWKNAVFIEKVTFMQHYLDRIFLEKKALDIYVKGTNFQINVWKALLNLPNGIVASYQDIADYLEKPKAVRAVASAIGSNSIGYLIPCHRVIAKSGAMSGYKWGLKRKRILIAYEALEQKS